MLNDKLTDLVANVDPFYAGFDNYSDMSKFLVDNILLCNQQSFYKKLKKECTDLEQKNINLSFLIAARKEIEKISSQLFHAETQISNLRKFNQPDLKYHHNDHVSCNVKLSKMKSQVQKMLNDNELLQQQIDSLDKRINLMQRGRSFIPNATLPTPRRKRHKIFVKKKAISNHLSLESNIVLKPVV